MADEDQKPKPELPPELFDVPQSDLPKIRPIPNYDPELDKGPKIRPIPNYDPELDKGPKIRPIPNYKETQKDKTPPPPPVLEQLEQSPLETIEDDSSESSRIEQAKHRVAARGQQRAKERKQRLGRLPPDQPSQGNAGPLVDYEGPYQNRQQQPVPGGAAQIQQPPNLNAGGAGAGDNQLMGQLLDQLQQQTVLLTQIAQKIETLGTYGA